MHHHHQTLHEICTCRLGHRGSAAHPREHRSGRRVRRRELPVLQPRLHAPPLWPRARTGVAVRSAFTCTKYCRELCVLVLLCVHTELCEFLCFAHSSQMTMWDAENGKLLRNITDCHIDNTGCLNVKVLPIFVVPNI